MLGVGAVAACTVMLGRVAVACVVLNPHTPLESIEWVLRGGPALVLHLRDGHRFAVTLDHPRTPAALLTALQSRIPT